MQQNPSTSRAPDLFRVLVETRSGCFEMEVHRCWCPHGADRFHELARIGYYDNSRFFRVVAGKWAQFGIAGEPSVAQAWRTSTIPDDAPGQSNTEGFVAFANTGRDTRSTQIFINLGDNSDQNDREPGFAPFGQIVRGMDVVAKLYAGYGETSGGGMRAGRQDVMFAEGNPYLDREFPNLDKLVRLYIVAP
jgi:homoserine O-acetyltransferase